VTEKKLLECLILHSCVFLLTELAVLKIEAALHFLVAVSVLYCAYPKHMFLEASLAVGPNTRGKRSPEKNVFAFSQVLFLTVADRPCQ